MKKILLILSVALLISAMLVVSVSAVEWTVNANSAVSNDFSGYLDNDLDTITYRYYLPDNTIVIGYDGAVPYTDIYISIYFDGLDYAWSMFGSLNGASDYMNPTDLVSWTMGVGDVIITSDDEGANLDDAIYYFNTYVLDSLIINDTDESSLTDSILSVFLTVITSFGSILTLLVSLFYDGSLTFLGILAVSGLAISVILLIIYFVTRFLKFRG